MRRKDQHFETCHAYISVSKWTYTGYFDEFIADVKFRGDLLLHLPACTQQHNVKIIESSSRVS